MDDADDWVDDEIALYEQMSDDDLDARADLFTKWLRPRDTLFTEPADEVLVGWA
jgi:hypothetical protein